MNHVCLPAKLSQNSHQGYSAKNGGSHPCLDDFSPEIVLGWPEYEYDSAVDQVVARYYDATIGRFISPDTIVPNWTNPQTLNRYTYTLNNPLKYTDPSGHDVEGTSWFEGLGFSIWWASSKMRFRVTDDHGGVAIVEVTRHGASMLPDVWFSIYEKFWSSADTVLDLTVDKSKYAGGALGPVSLDYFAGKEMDGDDYHGVSGGLAIGANRYGNLGGGMEISSMKILKCPYGGPEAQIIDLPADSSDGFMRPNSTSQSATIPSISKTIYPTCDDCIAYLNDMDIYYHPNVGWTERVYHPSGMYSYESIDSIDEAVERRKPVE